MPRVSVILPTRDRPALLARAIASVVSQSEPDWELLVVDNNRAEAPVAEQAGLAPFLSDPRVRLWRAEHVGNAATARNVGLERAVGDWVTYLDDDDAFRPAKLAQQLACAERERVPLVLCGAAYHLAGRVRRIQCHAPAFAGDDLLLRAVWGTPYLLHRRTGLRFDPTLASGEDVEFSHRLCADWKLRTVQVVAEPLVDVYPQPTTRVNTESVGARRAAQLVAEAAGNRFSDQARRQFLARADLAQAKLQRSRGDCLREGVRVLGLSAGADWRIVANAWLTCFGVARGRWVS